jgi:hypothetical protein
LEAITHFLTAVIIQILCFKYFLFPLNIVFTIIFAFSSHILSDIFSNLTYHTPKVMKGDKFWIVWHVIIYSVSALAVILFIIPYWLAILSSYLPDIIDWHILRPIQKFRKRKNSESKVKYKYLIHPFIDLLRVKLFFWLPDLKYKKHAIMTELLIISILSFLIYLYI